MTLYNRGDPTSRKMEVIIAMLDHHGKYRWSKWPRFIGTWLLSAIYLRLLGQWSRFKLCLVKSQKIVWRRPGMLQASVWVHEQYECGGWEYGWFKNLVVMDQRAFVFATPFLWWQMERWVGPLDLRVTARKVLQTIDPYGQSYKCSTIVIYDS